MPASYVHVRLLWQEVRVTSVCIFSSGRTADRHVHTQKITSAMQRALSEALYLSLRSPLGTQEPIKLKKIPLQQLVDPAGGYRAATLALGYVRALNMLNLTQQARYLSSNSGGSWFTAAYSYQQLLPVNEFLGPYLPPQELGISALQQVKKGAHGAFATTISTSSIISTGVTGAASNESASASDFSFERVVICEYLTASCSTLV